VPDVTVSAPALAWAPVYPDQVFRARVLRPLGWWASIINPVIPPEHIGQTCLSVAYDRTSGLLINYGPSTTVAVRAGRTSAVSIRIGEC
jgi:hypothetical protein